MRVRRDRKEFGAPGPKTWSPERCRRSLGPLRPESVNRQNTKRNPSCTNRWKFDWATVLRSIRPKSAELVVWL